MPHRRRFSVLVVVALVAGSLLVATLRHSAEAAQATWNEASISLDESEGKHVLESLNPIAKESAGLTSDSIAAAHVAGAMPEAMPVIGGATLVVATTPSGGYCAAFMAGIVCGDRPLDNANPITYSVEAINRDTTVLAGMLADEASGVDVVCRDGSRYAAVIDGRFAAVVMNRAFDGSLPGCSLEVSLPGGQTFTDSLEW